MRRQFPRPLVRRSVHVCATLTVSGLVTILLLQKYDPDTLVRGRAWLFTSYVTPNIFNGPPSHLRTMGFLTDDPTEIKRWRTYIRTIPGFAGALDSAAAATDPLRKAEILTEVYSNNNSGVYGCGNVTRLADKFVKPGCCSDHTEIFLALASIIGFPAREVGNIAHVVVEVYDAKRHRWLFVDPTFSLWARGEDGTPLSWTQVRTAVLQNQPLDLVSFRQRALTARGPGMIQQSYRREVFNIIFLTDGNNVFAEDRLRGHLASLPKVLDRLAGYALGVTPRYVALDDVHDASDIKARSVIKQILWTLVAIDGCILIGYPLITLCNFLFVRRRNAKQLMVGLEHAPTDPDTPLEFTPAPYPLA